VTPEHRLVLLRPGHGQHPGVRAGDELGLGPEAARDDDAPVFLQRLADGLEAFGLGAVEEAAGVHDHRLGAGVVGADRIALGPQAREDAFAVDKRLGTAKADHADGRLAVAPRLGDGRSGKIGAQVGRVGGHGAALYGMAGARGSGREAAECCRCGARPERAACPLRRGGASVPQNNRRDSS
jgi:hypothetical protein